LIDPAFNEASFKDEPESEKVNKSLTLPKKQKRSSISSTSSSSESSPKPESSPHTNSKQRTSNSKQRTLNSASHPPSSSSSSTNQSKSQEDRSNIVTKKEPTDQHRRRSVTIKSKLGVQEMMIRDFLSSIPLFADLEDEQLLSLENDAFFEDFEDGEIIIRQGDVGDKFYILQKGMVEILLKTDEGDDSLGRVVNRLSDGSFFGERALITSEPRGATVRSYGPTTVIAFDKAVFDSVLSGSQAIFGDTSTAINWTDDEELKGLFNHVESAEYLREILNKYEVLEEERRRDAKRGRFNKNHEEKEEEVLPTHKEMLDRLRLELATKLYHDQNSEEILQRMGSIIERYLNSEGFKIYMKDEDGNGELILIASDKDKGSSLSLEIQSTIETSVFQRSEAEIVNDARSDPRFESRPSSHQTERNVLCIPLISTLHEDIVGVLEVTNKRASPLAQKMFEKALIEEEIVSEEKRRKSVENNRKKSKLSKKKKKNNGGGRSSGMVSSSDDDSSSDEDKNPISEKKESSTNGKAEKKSKKKKKMGRNQLEKEEEEEMSEMRLLPSDASDYSYLDEELLTFAGEKIMEVVDKESQKILESECILQSAQWMTEDNVSFMLHDLQIPTQTLDEAGESLAEYYKSKGIKRDQSDTGLFLRLYLGFGVNKLSSECTLELFNTMIVEQDDNITVFSFDETKFEFPVHLSELQKSFSLYFEIINPFHEQLFSHDFYLFNFRGLYQEGHVSLVCHSSSNCTCQALNEYYTNLLLDSETDLFHCSVINLEFPTYHSPIAFFPQKYTTRVSNQDEVQLAEDDLLFLQEVGLDATDPTHTLCDEEKERIWELRYAFASHPNLFHLLFLSIDWLDPKHVKEFYSLMDIAEKASIKSALLFLDRRFIDPKIRQYAIDCLESANDEDLQLYMLQLIQQLRCERNVDSYLARFLLRRALKNKSVVGHGLYWGLVSEKHIPSNFKKFNTLLDLYLKFCGDHRTAIGHQMFLMNKLVAVSTRVLDGQSKEERNEIVKREIDSLILPPQFQLPINPYLVFSSIKSEKCRVMNSKKKPLFLCLTVSHRLDKDGNAIEVEGEEEIYMMFKTGDDLRQDQLTLQLLKVMNKLWKDKGIDFK